MNYTAVAASGSTPAPTLSPAPSVTAVATHTHEINSEQSHVITGPVLPPALERAMARIQIQRKLALTFLQPLFNAFPMVSMILKVQLSLFIKHCLGLYFETFSKRTATQIRAYEFLIVYCDGNLHEHPRAVELFFEDLQPDTSQRTVIWSSLKSLVQLWEIRNALLEDCYGVAEKLLKPFSCAQELERVNRLSTCKDEWLLVSKNASIPILIKEMQRSEDAHLGNLPLRDWISLRLMDVVVDIANRPEIPSQKKKQAELSYITFIMIYHRITSVEIDEGNFIPSVYSYLKNERAYLAQIREIDAGKHRELLTSLQLLAEDPPNHIYGVIDICREQQADFPMPSFKWHIWLNYLNLILVNSFSFLSFSADIMAESVKKGMEHLMACISLMTKNHIQLEQLHKHISTSPTKNQLLMLVEDFKQTQKTIDLCKHQFDKKINSLRDKLTRLAKQLETQPPSPHHRYLLLSITEELDNLDTASYFKPMHDLTRNLAFNLGTKLMFLERVLKIHLQSKSRVVDYNDIASKIVVKPDMDLFMEAMRENSKVKLEQALKTKFPASIDDMTSSCEKLILSHTCVFSTICFVYNGLCLFAAEFSNFVVEDESWKGMLTASDLDIQPGKTRKVKTQPKSDVAVEETKTEFEDPEEIVEEEIPFPIEPKVETPSSEPVPSRSKYAYLVDLVSKNTEALKTGVADVTRIRTLTVCIKFIEMALTHYKNQIIQHQAFPKRLIASTQKTVLEAIEHTLYAAFKWEACVEAVMRGQYKYLSHLVPANILHRHLMEEQCLNLELLITKQRKFKTHRLTQLAAELEVLALSSNAVFMKYFTDNELGHAISRYPFTLGIAYGNEVPLSVSICQSAMRCARHFYQPDIKMTEEIAIELRQMVASLCRENKQCFELLKNRFTRLKVRDALSKLDRPVLEQLFEKIPLYFDALQAFLGEKLQNNLTIAPSPIKSDCPFIEAIVPIRSYLSVGIQMLNGYLNTRPIDEKKACPALPLTEARDLLIRFDLNLEMIASLGTVGALLSHVDELMNIQWIIEALYMSLYIRKYKRPLWNHHHHFERFQKKLRLKGPLHEALNQFNYATACHYWHIRIHRNHPIRTDLNPIFKSIRSTLTDAPGFFSTDSSHDIEGNLNTMAEGMLKSLTQAMPLIIDLIKLAVS